MKRNLQAGRLGSGGLSLNVFTEAELDDIHLASLEILERTGVWVEADDALDIFRDGGCAVDRETRMVRIPPHLAEAAVRSAPPKNYLCGRDPAQDIVLEAGRVTFSNFDEGIMVVDPRSGERRHPVLRDVHEAARLVDALPDIDTYESAVHPGDVPEETASLHKWLAAVENTGKPVGTEATSAYDCRKLIEMGTVIAGGEDEFRRRPLIGFGVCAVSPLKLPRDATEVIIESARAWCPDTVLSMAMAGGSSPVTLAGTLVQHNAEVLGGIVLSQLVERGCPVTYGSSTTAMDLRLAAASVGSPELALFSAACAQIARRYLLPSFVAGLQADSKLGDAQTGHEKTLTGLLPALAGANQIYGAGMIESGVTFDLGQLVMDDEIARMIKFTVAGIGVSDDTLAVDDIASVGAFGDFLSLDATLRHMRELSQPALLDRRVREDWESRGASDLAARACTRALELVESHRPEPLDPDVAEQLRRIVEAADREKGVT